MIFVRNIRVSRLSREFVRLLGLTEDSRFDIGYDTLIIGLSEWYSAMWLITRTTWSTTVSRRCAPNKGLFFYTSLLPVTSAFQVQQQIIISQAGYLDKETADEVFSSFLSDLSLSVVNYKSQIFCASVFIFYHQEAFKCPYFIYVVAHERLT